MALVLEDGSIVTNANSYATEATLDNYTDDRSITLADGDAEAALIRATAAIDALYRASWPGYKRGGRAQSLEWPRSQAYDANDELIGDDEIPSELVQAVCEGAIRELAEPGSLLPDLERGGGIKRMRAGSVEVEYGNTASNQTVFSIIGNLLSGLIGAPSSLSVTSARG